MKCEKERRSREIRARTDTCNNYINVTLGRIERPSRFFRHSRLLVYTRDIFWRARFIPSLHGVTVRRGKNANVNIRSDDVTISASNFTHASIHLCPLDASSCEYRAIIRSDERTIDYDRCPIRINSTPDIVCTHIHIFARKRSTKRGTRERHRLA